MWNWVKSKHIAPKKKKKMTVDFFAPPEPNSPPKWSLDNAFSKNVHLELRLLNLKQLKVMIAQSAFVWN